MDNDINEPYTTKEFGKDVAKEVAFSVASVAAAYGMLLIAGFTYTKVTELRARRAARKTQIES